MINKNFNHFNLLVTMKKNGNRAIIASETTDVKDALVTIKTAAGTGSPINQDDKVGAKLADKELELMPWVLENIAHIENRLRRNFDEDAVTNNLLSLKNEQKQLDELKPIVAHLESSITARRVELKTNFTELYKAAEETKNDNSAMAFIYDKIKVLYARPTSAAETKAAEKVIEKEAFKVAKAAATEALMAAKTIKATE